MQMTRLPRTYSTLCCTTDIVEHWAHIESKVKMYEKGEIQRWARREGKARSKSEQGGRGMLWTRGGVRKGQA